VSTGRWDGDTLIIETSNFNGVTKLDTAGHPHSKQLKLTNSFKRIDSQTMEHTVTVHDPKTYKQDWMNIRTWRVKPANEVIMEYSCNENNLRSLIEGSIKVWQYPDDVDK
jgi:carbamoylphosphate synthase small subunit